jgi:P27 family predicted phage terminase small subunit
LGKRGPSLKPTVLKVLEGNKYAANPDEPKPKPIFPKPPAWLNQESKKVWKDLAPKLESLGLLTETDLLDFQNLCLAAAQLKMAQKVLDKEGLVMVFCKLDKDGNEVSRYIQQRPEVTIVHKNMELVNKLGAKFGLSPADRAGVTSPKSKQRSSKLAGLLSG